MKLSMSGGQSCLGGWLGWTLATVINFFPALSAWFWIMEMWSMIVSAPRGTRNVMMMFWLYLEWQRTSGMHSLTIRFGDHCLCC